MLRLPPRNHSRRGVTAVELAVAISVFLLIVFAVIEYGRFIMIRQVLQNAAREGARVGIITPNDPVIQAQVTRSLANQPINPVITTGARDALTSANKPLANAGFGDMIVVEVSGTYKPMLPTLGFLPSTVNLKATSIMRCETN